VRSIQHPLMLGVAYVIDFIGCGRSPARTRLGTRVFSRIVGLKTALNADLIRRYRGLDKKQRENNREFCGLIRASCSLSRDRGVYIRDGHGA
jgi:hypothetical protein